MDQRQKYILQVIIGIIVFIAIYILILMILSKYGISIQDIRSFAERLGAFGIAFLIVLMMLSVMSPFPDTPAAIVANVLYGPWIGAFIYLSGAFIGAVLDFVIARKLGRKFLKHKYPVLFENANRIIKKFGFPALIFFRMFPTVTFDIVSYVAAITKIKFTVFAAATLLGLLPLTITYSILGAGLESDDYRKIVLSIIIGLGFFVCILIALKVIGDKLKISPLEEDD